MCQEEENDRENKCDEDDSADHVPGPFPDLRSVHNFSNDSVDYGQYHEDEPDTYRVKQEFLGHIDK